jgi:hypothetical protein
VVEANRQAVVKLQGQTRAIRGAKAKDREDGTTLVDTMKTLRLQDKKEKEKEKEVREKEKEVREKQKQEEEAREQQEALDLVYELEEDEKKQRGGNKGKKEKRAVKDTTQANVNKLFGVQAGADGNMEVDGEEPGDSSGSKDVVGKAVKRKGREEGVQEGPKRKKISKEVPDLSAAPAVGLDDQADDGNIDLLTEDQLSKLEAATPLNRPRLFKNFYEVAFKRNGNQPIRKFQNVGLMISEAHHESGMRWAQKAGVAIEGFDAPAVDAESPAAKAPKQKASKQKASKTKVGQVRVSLELKA